MVITVFLIAITMMAFVLLAIYQANKAPPPDIDTSRWDYLDEESDNDAHW